ncbi:MAG: FkbM family methyltransferase [Pseudanabaenaceae cyanobacterium bins.68]|nr:FkbM family methyltransferase [Pseudanabaenaceae cyanobacterium bins.68]
MERLKILLKQFGLWQGIWIFLAELTRKIFDPHNVPSYAQTGEDRIIAAILGAQGVKIGFYVDVGCNQPQHWSNTYQLYKRGWRGITIDAIKSLINQHQKLRQQDVSVCAVVSDRPDPVVFTEFADNLVSSINPSHVEGWKSKSKVAKEYTLIPRTLTQILEDCQAPAHFDLLSIDVEGHDFEVLRSLDLNRFQPRLIVIEMHDFDFTNPQSNQVYNYLDSYGYQLVAYAVMNSYFLKPAAQVGDLLEFAS